MKMHKNSLFAVLLRSPWWVSIAIAVGTAVMSRFVLVKFDIPDAYAIFVALPFIVIGCVAGWQQLRAPSAERIATTLEALRNLSWEEFSGALETAFQRDGYAVSRPGVAGADLELTRAGLGDEILLALIEVDGPVFPIDTETLKRLKEVGVSERVIVAMVRSGRTRADVQAPVMLSEPEPARVEPQVVVIDHHDAPQVREVPVAVPVYVPYAVRSDHSDRGRDDSSSDDSWRPDTSRNDSSRDGAAHVKPVEPVYWSFGGKLRPDAWQPAPAPPPVKKNQ